MKQNLIAKRNIISLKGILRGIRINEKEIIFAKKSLYNIDNEMYKN